jgi:hypothetical protein
MQENDNLSQVSLDFIRVDDEDRFFSVPKRKDIQNEEFQALIRVSFEEKN